MSPLLQALTDRLVGRVVPAAPGYRLRTKGTPHRKPVVAWLVVGNSARPLTADLAGNTALELPDGEVATPEGPVYADWRAFIAAYHSDEPAEVSLAND
jgi:hypothetical protein